MGRAQVWPGPSDAQATHGARNSAHPQPSGQRTGIHPFPGGDNTLCTLKLPGLPKASLGAHSKTSDHLLQDGLRTLTSAMTRPPPSIYSLFIRPLIYSSTHHHRHHQQPQQLQHAQAHKPSPKTLHPLPHTSTSQANCTPSKKVVTTCPCDLKFTWNQRSSSSGKCRKGPRSEGVW